MGKDYFNEKRGGTRILFEFITFFFRYLVAELSCSSSETLKKLTEYLETQIQNGPTSSSTDPPPSIPYLFKTPHGFDIDLRLFNNDVMSTAKPHILHILSSGLHGWFMERKQDILNQLRKEETPEEEIDNRAYQILKREYLERVCEGVRKDQGIDSIGVGITELLVEQVKTSLIVDEILKETRERIRDHREKVEGQLKASQPVLCHIGPWMRRKLEASNEAYMNKHQWKAHEEAIASCKDAGLEQSAYFLSRDLTFRRDREPVLRKELRHLKYPEKTFKFTTYIWLPKNYVVMERKAPNRSYERIPTVISEREEYQYLAGTPDMDVHRFYLNKETYRTNSTKYPFWRWTNFFFRTWSWLWNTIFLLGVVVPWCSALSFRALIYKEPFYVEYELNPRNGSLQKKQNSRTETVLSRFKALWSHIRQSRKAFETQPDTGLLPRTVIRHFNRFVNYVIKGFFGSSFILLVLPVAIVSVSLTSLLLAATAPLWLVGASIVGHIFAAFTCDFDGTSYLGAVLWNVLINIIGLGILQPILAALVAFVFCPVGTCVLTLIAVIRKTLRDTWDALVFQLLIKKRARVPMSNTFLARRIAGPGMASEYYYQVRPEQALVALETRMEAAELKAYDNQTSQKILEPQKSCHNFLKRMFRPFGVMPSRKTAGPVMQLETESEELLAKLREKLEERWENLRPSLTGDVTARVS